MTSGVGGALLSHSAPCERRSQAGAADSRNPSLCSGEDASKQEGEVRNRRDRREGRAAGKWKRKMEAE